MYTDSRALGSNSGEEDSDSEMGFIQASAVRPEHVEKLDKEVRALNILRYLSLSDKIMVDR